MAAPRTTIFSFPRFSNRSPNALIASLNRRADIAGKYMARRSRPLPTFDIRGLTRTDVPNRRARLSAAWHKPSIGGRLACALEPIGGAELAYNDRSGLEANPRNRVQQRASVLQLRILLDMLFDFFGLVE